MVNYLICPARDCPENWMIELPVLDPDPDYPDELLTAYDLGTLGNWATTEIDALVMHLDSVEHDPEPVMALIVVEGPAAPDIGMFRAQAGGLIDTITRAAAQQP